MAEVGGTFIARTAGTSEENGVLTTGVGENADGSGRALLFMSPAPGDPDTRMFVCDEVGATPDDDVVEIRLNSTELHVRFARRPGADRDDEYTISLALEDQQRAIFTDGLLAVAARWPEPPKLVLE